jgi:hypothetical protein
MRTNPKVCIQIDEIANQSEWLSVIINGSYQELPEPQYTDERAHARKLLRSATAGGKTRWASASSNRVIVRLFLHHFPIVITGQLGCVLLASRSTPGARTFCDYNHNPLWFPSWPDSAQ